VCKAPVDPVRQAEAAAIRADLASMTLPLARRIWDCLDEPMTYTQIGSRLLVPRELVAGTIRLHRQLFTTVTPSAGRGRFAVIGRASEAA
jgi:hypothetical protein